MKTTVTRFEERFVEAAGFRIRYEEAGDGDVLVYVHGAAGPDVGPALELLAEHRRVVALEIPGWGSSPDNDRTTDALDMATTLRAAVQAIGIERHALLGTSMGGVVSLWWATEFPDEISALVLEAPAAFRVRDPDPVALSDRDTYLAAFHAQPQRKPWLEGFEIPAMRSPALFERLLGPLHDAALADRLRALPVPVLVMFGTADGVMSRDQGRRYKETVPDCHFALVYDAAHDLKGDRPEAFADLVTDFLDEGSFLVNRSSTLINP